MAVTKSALLRYTIIDKCLTNRRRKWTLEDLINAVSDALYEQEGIQSGVSKRTIQADIQTMRSDKLGYNAPIIVIDKKYYTYEDPAFSIHKVAISDADIQQLKHAISIIKQLSGFSYLEEMNDVVLRLEHSFRKHTTFQKQVVHLEQNLLVKGLNWIPELIQYIQHEVPILLTYKSFKAKHPSIVVFYPYLLKEYRNRWFLIGKCKGSKPLHIRALDRIIDIEEMAKKDFVAYDGVSFERYFDECIGVTRSESQRARKVVFRVNRPHDEYLITKPLHNSQKILKTNEEGTIFRIDVILNFELEKDILSMGEVLQVISPQSLKLKIADRIQKMANLYSS